MLDFTTISKLNVEKALGEYKKLGRRKFMRLVRARAGARTWFVRRPGSQEKFDLKLITARAYNLSHPEDKPVRPVRFNTRSARWALGARLGYQLIGPGARTEDKIKREIEKFGLSKLKKAFDKARRLARVRQGAPQFRRVLLDAYKRCAITGERTTEALQAAHLVPYRGATSNHVQNGILLRADVHALFDSDLIRIEPADYKIRIDESLKGTPYFKYHGKTLKLPKSRDHHPALVALNERRRIFSKLH
jgi:predicted restriction endonuclease